MMLAGDFQKRLQAYMKWSHTAFLIPLQLLTDRTWIDRADDAHYINKHTRPGYPGTFVWPVKRPGLFRFVPECYSPVHTMIVLLRGLVASGSYKPIAECFF